MILISGSGLCVYSLVIIVLLLRKNLRQKSYFRIASWLGIADCICLVLMMCYSAPSILVGHILHPSPAFGGCLNIGWFTGLMLILFIAGDRYLCMVHQLTHRKYYSIQKIKWYCLFCWVFGVAYSVPSFALSCSVQFHVDIMTWGWLVRYACAQWLSYGELIMVVTITLTTFVLNGLVLR